MKFLKKLMRFLVRQVIELSLFVSYLLAISIMVMIPVSFILRLLKFQFGLELLPSEYEDSFMVFIIINLAFIIPIMWYLRKVPSIITNHILGHNEEKKCDKNGP